MLLADYGIMGGVTNIPTVSFTPLTPSEDLFWGKPDLLPSGDRRSCFHSHMGLWAMVNLRERAAMVIAGMHPENSLDAEPLAATLVEDAPVSGDGLPKMTAIVNIHGAITKKRSKFSETSALEVRHLIRQLANDDTIGKIVLHIDSPGGAVSGVPDLAKEVKRATGVKPVVAFIEDLGASAAYWIASQCTEVVANESAFVGSLGTYGIVHDVSGAYERQGVKVHLISSGGIKGKGAEGTVVDEEVLADQQRIVDTINSMFKADVAGGRNFSQAKVDKLFDGRVHGASEALSLGLIDRIGTFESAIGDDPSPNQRQSDEEEEEDMHEEEAHGGAKAALDIEELRADVAELAKTVKSSGCPLSIESIERKLMAAGSRAADNLSAIALANEAGRVMASMRPVVGEYADNEPSKAHTPTSYPAMVAEYKRLLKEAKASGVSAEHLAAHLRDRYPELVASMCKELTRRTDAARAGLAK